MSQPQSDSVLLKFLAGGLSCAVCSALLNPADLIKVRMVTTNELRASASSSHGHASTLTFAGAAREIVRSEGALALWKRGLVASCCREMTYSSARMGMYEPIKTMLSTGVPAGHDIGLLRKILAGLISGSLGSAVANPTDLVKIRFQAERPSHPLPYRNTFHAFAYIYRHEGFGGLYRGTLPTMIRAAILTSAQLSSYDHSKHLALRNGWAEEGPVLHVSCALISALITTTVTNPADVIKTRYMNRQHDSYSSPLDCLVKTVKFDGVRSLWRGWLPNFARLGPHFLISLPLLEATRKLFGLKAM